MEENKLTAPDLMIGDWVFDTESNINREVVEICDDGIIGFIDAEEGDMYDTTFVERLRGVPLTKEILESNEFVPLEEDSYIYKEKTEDNDFRIVVDLLVPFLSHMEKNNNPKTGYSGEIKFVHQLQQAMKLCKIEKKIIVY